MKVPQDDSRQRMDGKARPEDKVLCFLPFDFSTWKKKKCNALNVAGINGKNCRFQKFENSTVARRHLLDHVQTSVQ